MIDVILRQIQNKNEVSTSIPKQQMRYLFYFAPKMCISVKIGMQTLCAMGLPLGPVLAGIFMVELERLVLPNLREQMSPQKRYVDDTISFKKEEYFEHVLFKLNGYHDNKEFTYGIGNDGKLTFLDVLVIRKYYQFETIVYHKSTNNDISSLAVVFPNNMERRDAADISFMSLWSGLQQLVLEK